MAERVVIKWKVSCGLHIRNEVFSAEWVIHSHYDDGLSILFCSSFGWEGIVFPYIR